MLKNKTKIIAIFLVLILLLAPVTVFADNEVNDNDIALISADGANNETTEPVENLVSDEHDHDHDYETSIVSSDVYLFDDNVTIDYSIDGNLFVMADTVTINSEIGGDAFIIAKNLIIDSQGYIYSNLFAIADSIEIKGVVCDIFALSNNCTISGGYIFRDLKLACDTLNLNGIIGRNAFVNFSSINFNTDGNNNALIYGNLDYTSESEAYIPENIINGTVNYTASEISSEESIGSIISDYIFDLGRFLVFVLIIWLLCLVIAPKFLEGTNKYVGKKTLSVFGYGLLSLIVIPIACIILILLQLTSGFSLFLLALYVLAIVISKSLFTITANNYVCSKLKINKNVGIFGMLIVSSIVIWLITKVPYIGGLVSFIISVLGLGILVNSILPKKDKKNEVIVENEDDSKKDEE